MLVYDHGYGKKYRYHDSWGWVSYKYLDLKFSIGCCPGHM